MKTTMTTCSCDARGTAVLATAAAPVHGSALSVAGLLVADMPVAALSATAWGAAFGAARPGPPRGAPV